MGNNHRNYLKRPDTFVVYSHGGYASLLAQRPKAYSTVGTRRETLGAFSIDYDTLDVVSVS